MAESLHAKGRRWYLQMWSDKVEGSEGEVLQSGLTRSSSAEVPKPFPNHARSSNVIAFPPMFTGQVGGRKTVNLSGRSKARNTKEVSSSRQRREGFLELVPSPVASRAVLQTAARSRGGAATTAQPWNHRERSNIESVQRLRAHA